MNEDLNPIPLRLALDPFSRLVVTLPGGESVAGVIPTRCFPFSAPDEHIALCDEQGHEVCSVARIDALAPDAQTLLRAALARRELVPKVKRIIDISPGADPSEWHVETDRGEVRFLLPNEDSVRRLEPDGALMTDECGVRYHVPDIHRLDTRSRKLLRRYL